MRSPCALLLPSGYHTDPSTKPLRELTLLRSRNSTIVMMTNEGGLFPEIRSGLGYDAVIWTKIEKSASISTIKCAYIPAATTRDLVEIGNKFYMITSDQTRKISPGSLAIPMFESKTHSEIVWKILVNGELLIKWERKYQLEFSKETYNTKEAGYLIHSKFEIPYTEGPAVQQYLWMKDRCRKGYRYKTWQDRFPDWNKGYRISYQLIVDQTNTRRCNATIVPPKTVCGQNTPTLSININERSNELLAFLLAVWNSFCFEFLVKTQSRSALSWPVINQMTIPLFEKSKAKSNALVINTARLVCTTDDFSSLWNNLSDILGEWLASPWHENYGVTKPRERAEIRGKNDAIVADLYEFSEHEFAYVLFSYKSIDRDQSPLPGELKSTITRDLALLELFKLRGKIPPYDIVPFFAEAGVDISEITGPVRGLEERVEQALALGAVAYVPSGRGGGEEEELLEENWDASNDE
jgi:hypothetical protein